EALVRSARLYLFDAAGRVRDDVLAGRGAAIGGGGPGGLAAWHAGASAAPAVGLVFFTGGATPPYTTSPIAGGFRDVHAITLHIGVHPRNLESVGQVLYGLEPKIPPGLLAF